MIATRVALKATLRAVSAVALTAVALFTSGCSVFSTPIGSDTMPMTGAVIKGAVHGGQQPIYSATIGLYVAGSTGYGSSGGSNLLSSPVYTAADGTFTITGDYTCPSGSSLVYLTASGGDSGSGPNSAIMLVAPLGACGGLSSGTFININEVTTAATALALGQFISPASDNIGTSSTNNTGLLNAFNTVNSLVNIATGNAVTSATLGSVTATPESAKLYTIANILAACVNSAGPFSTPCSTLFPAVTPGSATAPSDIFQAAVYMSQNPTSNNSGGSTTNLTNLFALQSGTSPFVGVSPQPTDWTVGIQYQDATTLPQPLDVAADASGNIWVLSLAGAVGTLTELNPTGTPQVSLTTLDGYSMSAVSPRNVAVDTNGNVWVQSSSSGTGFNGDTFEYVPGGTSPSAPIQTGSSGYGLAIDGNNNIWVGKSGSSATQAVNEFINGNLLATYQVQFPTDISNTRPAYAAVDTAGNVWLSSAGVSAPLENRVVQLQQSSINISGCGSTPFSPAPCPSSSVSATYNTVTTGTSSITLNEPWAMAAGPSGVIWTPNFAGNSLAQITSAAAGNTFGSATSLSSPKYPAVDGAGNVWVTNNIVTPASVSEFSSGGAILSPINSGGLFTAIGFSHAGLGTAAGITLDPSGNVWVADNGTSGVAQYSVFEVVGAAAPTVTPIALALKNSAVGAKP